MLGRGVIRESKSPYYSQVHLAPKPGTNKFRFCIDYRELNTVTKAQGWPLPNIKEMLQRLGARRSKYYAVLDLTSGYHKTPINLSSAAYTAFIVFCGVYEFLRVPFGLKSAGSYFQNTMASVVLGPELLYFVCEAYLDDIIVDGQDEDDFITNLRKVLTRLQLFGVKLNPEKLRLGLKELEYVGHVINGNGLNMSKVKIERVLDFALPTTLKTLRSFLGLANYFRDHVKNYASIATPLHAMTTVKKGSKLAWTQPALSAYEEIKSLIEQCPTLFFLNDTDPVFLYTDASDYGIGAHLYQVVNGKEVSISFISKSLNAVQRKWDVPEREAYAIYYGIIKNEYLLINRQFILRTDHDNLRYMNSAAVPKVYRWKLALQPYDFFLEYTKGEDNPIADANSRCCPDLRLLEDTHVDTVAPTKDNKILSAFKTPFNIPSDKYPLIAIAHSGIAGYLGVEKTILALLQAQDPWTHMRAHVKEFKRNCPLCQKIDATTVTNNITPFEVSSYSPMQTVSCDFLGPFPDDQYVLVVVDCFSRWVELFLSSAASAEQAAKHLLSHVGRFGTPSQLISDQGSHFINKVIKQFTALVGTKHIKTIAYSKQENSIVERQNKEINRHIQGLIFESNSLNYQDVLPFVQRILNSTINLSTKLAPAQLLFGNSINLDQGIFILKDEIPLQNREPLAKRYTSMLETQERLIAYAVKNLQVKDNAHYNKSQLTLSKKGVSSVKQLTEYELGSMVLVSYPSGPPTRLHTRWRGPMEVVQANKAEYTLKDLVTNKLRVYHIKRLKPFFYNPLHTNPREVAAKDLQEFVIDSIRDHQGSFTNKSDLTFTVHWAGYDTEDDTDEPWSNLKDTDQLHAYLTDNKLEQHIPRQHKMPKKKQKLI